MTVPPSTPEAIERALNEAFTELAPLRVTGILGSGFNSIAVETDRGVVFRVAKTPGTAERYAREACLLPVIRPHLPVAVPEPRWLVERSAAFPHGVSGYEKLPGRVLSPEILPQDSSTLAAQVADALLALHRVPLNELAPCRMPQPEHRPAHYRRLRRETTPALRSRLGSDEFARLERWWEAFLADERMSQFEPVLAHGDFWYENMLVDDSVEKLVGIVDWEDAAVADPMLDFALHLGPDFRAQVIVAYRRAGGTFGAEEEHRMRRLWELREFEGVHFGVRFQDQRELADSTQKLRAGPIFDVS